MSNWITVDAEKLRGLYSKKRFRPDSLILPLGLEPMKGDVFRYVVVDFLKEIGPSTDEFFVASYMPKRADNVTCIQAIRNTDGTYYVEILKNFDEDDIPFHVYVKDRASLYETILYFETVLVFFKCPDVELWDDDTENQLKQMKEQEGGIY